MQSLKETFAEKLPAEIEKVKKLRKYVIFLLAFFLTPMLCHCNQVDWL
jgi:hypothetical protein